ncbi:FMN binding protein [Perilla frutescens var. frutescens]|nr:FMN binding protein [Perilla frutescens var. frutescens]
MARPSKGVVISSPLSQPRFQCKGCITAGYQGKSFKLRIPFTRRATERKDVKTLVIEMLQAAKTQTS